MTEEGRRNQLRALVRASPNLLEVLTLAERMQLPDWMLVSGAVYQTVWNHLTGRDAAYGLKDYDLAYFDADTSWSAEDRAIKTAAKMAPAPLKGLIEVRNQARVHLWFEAKFGEAYSPLGCTADMLERFLCPAFAVGIRLGGPDQIQVFAPFGLKDCFAMRLRRNPLRPVAGAGFDRVAASCQMRWPEVTVIR